MFVRRIRALFVLSLLVPLAAACGGGGSSFDQQVAVVVALTQTAAALQPAPAATQTPVPAGDYQPLDANACTSLQNAISQSTGVTATLLNPAPFDDYVNNKKGTGCQMTFSVTGKDTISSPALDTLKSLGYAEDTLYGAGGVGGMITAYKKGNALCLLALTVGPVDPSLCPMGQGYITCMGNLQPQQLRHSVELNCALPTSP